MGFRVEVAGRQIEAVDFSYQEDSTPLSADDTSGSVGSITVSVPYPNRDLLRSEPAESTPTWWTPIQTNLWVKPWVDSSDIVVLSGPGSVSMSPPLAETSSGRAEIPVLSSPLGEVTVFEILPYGDFRKSPTVNTGPRFSSVPLSTGEVVITDNASVSVGVQCQEVAVPGDFSLGVRFGVRTRDGFGAVSDVWEEEAEGVSTTGFGEYIASAPSADRPLGSGFSTILVEVDGTSTSSLYIDRVSLQYLGREMFESLLFPGSGGTDTYYLKVFDGDVGLEPGNVLFSKFEWVSVRQNSPTIRSVGSYYINARTRSSDIPDPYGQFGPEWLKGLPILLQDSDRGYTSGIIQEVSSNEETVTLTCETDLARLIAADVIAPALSGDLETVFRTYLSLSGTSLNLWVDPEISDQVVTLGAWSGELWFNLKQLARSLECDLNLVGGTIVLRPIREITAPRWRGLSRSRRLGSAETARGLEIYRYEYGVVEPATVVFPVPGDPQSLPSVNAGQTETFILQTSAYISGEFDVNIPGFTIGDDVALSVASFIQRGGLINTSLNPEDTSQVILTLFFPRGSSFFTSDGIEYIDSVQMRDGMTVVANNGVSFQKFLHYIPSGIGNDRTGSEVSVTIDDPFVSSAEIMYRIGTRAAAKLANEQFTLDGEVDTVLSSDVSGIITLTTYQAVQDEVEPQTYDGLQGLNPTYRADQRYWDDFGIDPNAPAEFKRQTFGNAPGSRIWDPQSRRWYRIRSATSDRSTTSYTADDDVLYSDVAESMPDGAVYGPTFNQTVQEFLDFEDPGQTLPGGTNVEASTLGISAVSGTRVLTSTISPYTVTFSPPGGGRESLTYYTYLRTGAASLVALSLSPGGLTSGIGLYFTESAMLVTAPPAGAVRLIELDPPMVLDEWVQVTFRPPGAEGDNYYFQLWQPSIGGSPHVISLSPSELPVDYTPEELQNMYWWSTLGGSTRVVDNVGIRDFIPAGPDAKVENVSYWNLTYELDRRFALYER